MTDVPTAASSGQFALGGDLLVNRLGFGTMRLTGPGVWGPPRDRTEAIRVLRRAAELGVTLFDTADSYGPAIAESLVRSALSSYYPDVVIATKAGLTRPGPGRWEPVGRPPYLRQQCELSLRNLGLETIALFQLHRVDPQVPLADQVGELKSLQQEGKIRHIGLSEVTVPQIEEALSIVPIVSVQNMYNLANRQSEEALSFCESKGIAFIPWFPLATGDLAKPDGPLAALGTKLSVTPSQIALAWLLQRSPVMLPIPGTSTVEHLEENVSAAAVHLSEANYNQLAETIA